MQKTSYDFALNIAILHTMKISDNFSSINNSIGFIPFACLITSVTIGLFGIFFVVQGQSTKLNKKLCKISEYILFWLFIMVTGAVGNTIQSGAVTALGNNTSGMLIGGAIGGMVAGIGVLISHSIGKLSLIHLTILGCAFMAFSFFSCIIEIIIILLGQKLP